MDTSDPPSGIPNTRNGPTADDPRPVTVAGFVLFAVGVLSLLASLWFADNARDVVSGESPTCDGEVMATDTTCRETRQEFVARTGRVAWYTTVEVESTYDEKLAHLDENAKLWTWFLGMASGTLGLILILMGTASFLENRSRRTAAYVVPAVLLLLVAATAAVGWSELRFEPDLRPGVILWRDPDTSIAAILMAGLVALGGAGTLQGVRFRPADLSAAAVRGPTVGGYPLAGWWERVVARVIDTVIVMIVFYGISIAVSIFAFAAVRPLLGNDPAVTVMQLAIPALGFLFAVLYDRRIADPKRGGSTTGKRLLGLGVVLREPAAHRVPPGAAIRRALAWWTPFLLAAFAAVGVGPVPPTVGALLLLVLPLLNGVWPLWDRGLRQSLNDRLARTAVVRMR